MKMKTNKIKQTNTNKINENKLEKRRFKTNEARILLSLTFGKNTSATFISS